MFTTQVIVNIKSLWKDTPHLCVDIKKEAEEFERDVAESKKPKTFYVTDMSFEQLYMFLKLAKMHAIMKGESAPWDRKEDHAGYLFLVVFWLLDCSTKWQVYFQEPATRVMVNIITLHDDIMFFLTFISIFVF